MNGVRLDACPMTVAHMLDFNDELPAAMKDYLPVGGGRNRRQWLPKVGSQLLRRSWCGSSKLHPAAIVGAE